MDSSAVRFAWSEVTPKVMPSTATTSSAEAKKTFAKSPNAGLVALVAGIGLIFLPVLVPVRPPPVAARVEGNLQIRHTGGSHGHVLDDFRGDPLVPHVQTVLAGRDVLDREGPVHPRLCVIAVRRDHDVRHHAGVHVAVHTYQAGVRERVALCLTPSVQSEVEPV